MDRYGRVVKVHVWEPGELTFDSGLAPDLCVTLRQSLLYRWLSYFHVWEEGGIEVSGVCALGGGLPGPDLWVVVRLVSEILMGDSLEKCSESGRCSVGVNQRSSIKMNRFIPSGVLKASPSVTALILSTSEELGRLLLCSQERLHPRTCIC